MTPAARVQAAIEVVDRVIAAARGNGPPADRIVVDWFRSRRFAGSSDRRAVRELAYAAIRACGEVPVSGRAAVLLLARDDAALAALFDGSRHAPAPIAPDEPAARPGVAPNWLEQALAASGIAGEEAEALLGRAPLDLRVNTLKADRDSLVLPVPAEPTIASQGLRLPAGTPVEQWDAWRDGLVEVQDTGSQLACQALAAQPGETVIDLCAGAGGKTLALAAAMADRGRLIACDTDRARLSRLLPRARRAGVGIVEAVLLDAGREAEGLAAWQGRADALLVDAPCSGSGTWRRNPEARWRLSGVQLARYAGLQGRLLDLAATLLRPGGRLVYVTC
jgi:16S rRNA (cytosine967-C5)-methyltransferase